MPDLPLNSPEMMAFLKNEPPIQCDDVEAWVSCGSDLKVINLSFKIQIKSMKFNTIFSIIPLNRADAMGVLDRELDN